MTNRIKNYLETHEKQYELIRYVIAGGLTTLLSMVIQYGMCFVLAPKTPVTGSTLRWIIDTINSADKTQMSIAAAVSWVISVLFAFWINRVMVFKVQEGSKGSILMELGQFAGSRLASFFLFEEGLMLLLKQIGISNMVNRVIVLVFVMVFNYVVSKFWIFKGKKKA